MADCDDMIIQIMDTYLKRYNLNTRSLDYYVRNILSNYCQTSEVEIDNIKFKFSDGIISNTIAFVAEELGLSNVYDFKNLDFKENDVVIDIGGNIGMISIYLAKKFPFLKIYAYEPLKQNYDNFITNIKLNEIPEGIIKVYRKAVTCDGRNVDMSINALNLGGSSISDVFSTGAITQKFNCNIESTTLENIIKEHNIEHIKLLKIDCEGSEYEILEKINPEYLKKITYLRGEFHENKELTQDYDIDKLVNYIEQYISDIKVQKARACFVM